MRSRAVALASRIAAPRRASVTPARNFTITSPGTYSAPRSSAAWLTDGRDDAVGLVVGSVEHAATSTANALAVSVREVTPVEIAARVFNGVLRATGGWRPEGARYSAATRACCQYSCFRRPQR
jgi:hypothetical protein